MLPAHRDVHTAHFAEAVLECFSVHIQWLNCWHGDDVLM